MKETIETSAPPSQVWQMWERAHAMHSEKEFESGQKGKRQFKYKILDVKKEKSFSILWKTLFVRLIFSHSVEPTKRGSKICYQVQIKGPFAWPIRFFIGKKIHENLSSVLKSIVRELESKGVK